MEFKDLKRQYIRLKDDINNAVLSVLSEGKYIEGQQVAILEKQLAEFIGVKHCITCADGTDALSLAFMTWEIGPGDAVFVPDFTFFSSGETIAHAGATPIFVDVELDTFNISVESLKEIIQETLRIGTFKPRAIMAIDLFGLPANYPAIKTICEKYDLLLLEDGAQGFGGCINNKKACGFGDISTTSFFPAKPLGCYGDGGAVFTDNDDYEGLIRSFKAHGKGTHKYDSIRVGMNSRLDTIQASILLVKLKSFIEFELEAINSIADIFSNELKDYVIIPTFPSGFYSSWASFTIRLENKAIRDGLKNYLDEKGIPTMVYYPIPLHKQKALEGNPFAYKEYYPNSDILSETVLSLPLYSDLTDTEIYYITDSVKDFFNF